MIRHTPRSAIWYDKIHHHGLLPTPVLHAFTEDGFASYQGTQRALQRHVAHGWLEVYKPTLYYAQTFWYNLRERAKRHLKDRERWQHNRAKFSSSLKHDALLSLAVASIDLKLNMTPHHEVVERIGTDRFEMNGRTVIPDRIFELNNEDGTFTTHIFEMDRATENVSTGSERKVIREIIEWYLEWGRTNQYKQDLDIDGGINIHWLTTDASRMRLMMDIAKDCKFMTFQTIDEKPALFKGFPQYQLVDEPWFRAGHSPVFIGQ